MSTQTDSYSDPKTNFLVKLINLLDTATWSLVNKQPYRTLQVLAALLSEIEITEDQQYAELRTLQHNLIFNYDSFMPTIPANRVRIYHFMISQYMGKTYFKDFKSFHFVNPKGGNFGK